MKELPPQHFTRYGKRFFLPDDGGWTKSERGKVLDTKHELLVLEGKDLFSLYRVWQSKAGQGVSEYYCILIRENVEKKYRLMLFFSGTEYLFVQEAGERRFISRTYHATQDLRSEAIHKDVGEIAWIHTEDITEVQ